MAEDQSEKTRVSVEPFKLAVLGGTFTVREVFSDPGGLDERVNMIRSTPADRWFVMLAEGEGSGADLLALIDEDFEFQSIAAGAMESD